MDIIKIGDCNEVPSGSLWVMPKQKPGESIAEWQARLVKVDDVAFVAVNPRTPFEPFCKEAIEFGNKTRDDDFADVVKAIETIRGADDMRIR